MTRTDPNGYVESYGSLTKPASCVSGLGNYDGMSDLLSWTDRNGHLTQYTWDDFGEPTKATYSDGKSVSYTWTNGGTLEFTNENHGHTSTTYDSLYRMSGDYVYDPATDTYLGGGVAHYDNANRLTTLNATNVTGAQPAINYTWDNANRMTAAGGYLGTVPFGYDAANRRTGLKLTNNIRGCYYYDTANELVNLTYMPTGTPTCPSSAPTSGYLGNLTYTYDGAGRVASRGGTLFLSALPSPVTSATYDADNRLLTWNVPGGGTSFTYDHNGNMLTAGSTTYTWDDRNRLATVTGGASFSYEPLGRRIFTTLGGTTKSYTYFRGNPLIEQQGNTVTAEILAGLGLDERYQRTTTTGSGAGAYSMLTDALGSTVALTNSSGAITTTYAYDPYGNTTATGTASDSSYQFTGRENDGTGLYEYRARYYSPQWGRFVSEDPLGFGGGDANLFRYVGGNPTTYRDPWGLWQFTISGGDGIGGSATLGYNSGQWNFGAWGGAGEGFSFDYDPRTSKCHKPGPELSAKGETDVKLAGMSGSLGGQMGLGSDGENIPGGPTGFGAAVAIQGVGSVGGTVNVNVNAESEFEPEIGLGFGESAYVGVGGQYWNEGNCKCQR